MSHDRNDSTATDEAAPLTLEDAIDYLDGDPDTVSRATEAATNRSLYAEQRDAAARFLLELEGYPKPRRAQ